MFATRKASQECRAGLNNLKARTAHKGPVQPFRVTSRGSRAERKRNSSGVHNPRPSDRALILVALNREVLSSTVPAI